MRDIIALIIVLLVVIACGKKPFYEQSQSISESGWEYGNRIDFSFDIDNTDSKYDLLLDVRHDLEYTYENTYVRIHTTFPNGETITDQVSLQLADEYDQWEGTCKGDKCTVTIVLQSNVKFKEKGAYKIEIEQYNRENPLPGIEKMTLKIVDAVTD